MGELTASLSLTLKKRFESWRERFVTRWNRFCESSLQVLVQRFESSWDTFSEEEHNAELEGILRSYNMTGFPINLKYTDVNPIIESLFNTGVYLIEDPSVEFALAVHCHAYPNSVLSAWVYMAALTRKD